MKKRIIYAVAGIALLTALWMVLTAPSTGRKFDRDYWIATDRFHMVYDMESDFEHAKGYTGWEMCRISRRRTGMAYGLVKRGDLWGLTRTDVETMLGERGIVRGMNDSNSVRYVIEAAKRPFHMYGESGFIYKDLVISFEDDKVVEAGIYDRRKA